MVTGCCSSTGLPLRVTVIMEKARRPCGGRLPVQSTSVAAERTAPAAAAAARASEALALEHAVIEVNAAVQLIEVEPFIAGMRLGDVAGAADHTVVQFAQFAAIGRIANRFRCRTAGQLAHRPHRLTLGI